MNGHSESDDIIMQVGKEVELGDSLLYDNNNRDNCFPTE